MYGWFESDQNADQGIGMSRRQFSALLRKTKEQLPACAQDEELHIKLMTALHHLTSNMSFEDCKAWLGVSHDAVDEGLQMLMKIVPKINVSPSEDPFIWSLLTRSGTGLNHNIPTHPGTLHCCPSAGQRERILRSH